MNFGILLLLFLFAFGVWRSFCAWYVLSFPESEDSRVYQVILSDVPRQTERTVYAEVLLAKRGFGKASSQKLMLTFRKDSLSSRLQPGDELVFKGAVRSPRNRGNPGEFDFAEYLSVKGISGQAFVDGHSWRLIRKYRGMDSRLSLWMNLRIKELLFRSYLLDMYRETGLQGEALALFSALTLGDKSGLPQDLKDIYAGVGVSHILALSGMHLTFLVTLLNWILLRYVRRGWGKWIAASAAIVIVWGYTFLAGLPVSLIRAACMYTLMLMGSLMGRSGFSINSLSFSAVLMLCLNPLFLYDMGFQLSFLAMGYVRDSKDCQSCVGAVCHGSYRVC